jgi:hypothetical protein
MSDAANRESLLGIVWQRKDEHNLRVRLALRAPQSSIELMARPNLLATRTNVLVSHPGLSQRGVHPGRRSVDLMPKTECREVDGAVLYVHLDYLHFSL